MNKFISLLLLAVSLFINQAAMSGEVVVHDLEVSLDPEKGTLVVDDFITLPKKGCEPACLLSLDKGLAILFSDAELKPYASGSAQVNAWSVYPGGENERLHLKYTGSIQHSLENISDSVGKSQHITRGTISEQGVYLDGDSRWYPAFFNEKGEMPVSFSMQVNAPDNWLSVSQGKRLKGGWSEQSPQQEIYLMEAPFQLYRKALPKGEALVYLRKPDAELAQSYLQATEKYLKLYSDMLGDYPYAKFALVENFWESGYGMPSFTLLGPSVIRLPFILNSSYPHEILHNWWGNGVYVDYDSGNWSEGLTSYLADHYLKQQVGKGAEYRLGAVQKYADYVKQGDDFPLLEFRGRHGDASAAVGYSKGLMFFHMLDNHLGHDVFIKGLRRFYRDFLFKKASYDNIRQSMQAVSGKDLKSFFTQWLTRSGAPKLQLTGVKRVTTDGGDAVKFSLVQTQTDPAFDLEIPVLITMENQPEPVRQVVKMSEKSQDFLLPVAGTAQRIAVDPDFDIFRKLDAAEIPVSLGKFFASEKTIIVLPEKAPANLQAAYRQLAESWAASRPGNWRIVKESEIKSLPDDTSVLLTGWENRFADKLSNTLTIHSDSIELDGNNLTKSDHSMMAVGLDKQRVIAWLATDKAEAVSGLARKLPHYGKYSYVAFTGPEPTNMLKGAWRVDQSPLSAELSGE